MKVAIICFLSFAAAWALPKGESEPLFKKLYVDPATDQLPSDVISRITNGKEAVPHSIPYQAYLTIISSSGQKWLCGGSLISPSHVLTASHCIDGGATATINLGVHNILETEPTQVIATSQRLILHGDYNKQTLSNDIGLLILDNPVELNENINVVALPSREATTDYEGVNARVSGWGRTSGTGDPSPVLMEVNGTVISNTQCKKIYSIVIDSQLCISGTGGVGSCSGDTGGPLVYENAQIGIVSYGATGCLSGFPSGFTRVSSYLDWLEENTGLKF